LQLAQYYGNNLCKALNKAIIWHLQMVVCLMWNLVNQKRAELKSNENTDTSVLDFFTIIVKIPKELTKEIIKYLCC